MRLHVTHRTRFTYLEPVKDSFNEARLQPTSSGGQRCDDFRLRVLPPAIISSYQDLYQNCVHLFDVSRAHRELMVTATSRVQTNDIPSGPPRDAATLPLANMHECGRLELCHDFLQPSGYIDLSPDLWRLALDMTDGLSDAWQAALAIMRQIHGGFRYQPNSTHVNTRTADVLSTRSGVCQDFAHLMVGLCRALKIPARYVSGYLYNGPADQLIGAQASHAWAEIYLPHYGWCGLDPTNNRIVDGHYVKIAVGRDYADVSPLRGTYRGTPHRKMTVDVLVSTEEPAAVS
jgi:transglutaminase-like putative cysteine protease